MDFIQKKIEQLIAKAAEAQKSEDAMRFSQAALNAAHTLGVLNSNIKLNKQ